jgi:hypothetical protein
MKKKCTKNAVEETKKANGEIGKKTQTTGKPLRADKLSLKKTIAESATGLEKPAVTENTKAAAGSAMKGKYRAEPLGIKKKFIEERNICEVTFRFPREASLHARKVTVVGDFNNWDKETNPLEKQDNGDFTTTLQLDAGKEYRFRYLIDSHRWENDWHADKYVKSPYEVEDSVVCA